MDKLDARFINVDSADTKNTVEGSDHIIICDHQTGEAKKLSLETLVAASAAQGVQLVGEADMDDAGTTPTSIVIKNNPDNATIKQGIAPVPNRSGIGFIVTTAAPVFTEITGKRVEVGQGDQIIWTGTSWSVLVLDVGVWSVNGERGAVTVTPEKIGALSVSDANSKFATKNELSTKLDSDATAKNSEKLNNKTETQIRSGLATTAQLNTLENKVNNKLEVDGKAADAAMLNGRSDYYNPENPPSAEVVGALPANAGIRITDTEVIIDKNLLTAGGGTVQFGRNYLTLGDVDSNDFANLSVFRAGGRALVACEPSNDGARLVYQDTKGEAGKNENSFNLKKNPYDVRYGAKNNTSAGYFMLGRVNGVDYCKLRGIQDVNNTWDTNDLIDEFIYTLSGNWRNTYKGPDATNMVTVMRVYRRAFTGGTKVVQEIYDNVKRTWHTRYGSGADGAETWTPWYSAITSGNYEQTIAGDLNVRNLNADGAIRVDAPSGGTAHYWLQIKGKDVGVLYKTEGTGTVVIRSNQGDGTVGQGQFEISTDGTIYAVSTANGNKAAVGAGPNDVFLSNNKAGTFLQLTNDKHLTFNGNPVRIAGEMIQLQDIAYDNPLTRREERLVDIIDELRTRIERLEGGQR